MQVVGYRGRGRARGEQKALSVKMPGANVR